MVRHQIASKFEILPMPEICSRGQYIYDMSSGLGACGRTALKLVAKESQTRIGKRKIELYTLFK